MTDQIDTLIRELEAAMEGSRELDASIFIEVTPGVKDAGRIDRKGGVVGWWPKDAPYRSAREVDPFTTSLDAALSLVPEGWITMHAGQNPVSGTWYWGLHKQAEAGVNDGRCQQTASDHQTNSSALALCIAALKARRGT